jgi:uncharacterized lipoprotein YajG
MRKSDLVIMAHEERKENYEKAFLLLAALALLASCKQPSDDAPPAPCFCR